MLFLSATERNNDLLRCCKVGYAGGQWHKAAKYITLLSSPNIGRCFTHEEWAAR